MFDWKRPQDMPITEPTEEQIWAVIEAHDPHRSAPVRDRLLWHQEMLQDRNIYGDAFARSPRMITFNSELPSGHNPTDWVTSLNLRHSHDVPLEKVADRLSMGTQNVLQPAADSAPSPGVVRILSYYILHHQAEDWDPKSVFGTPLAAVNGYTNWARYHLRSHHSVLKKAGIYQAIYASLFDYSRLPFAWIRGITEHWDKTTNTCWIGPHELTITLADMQDVTGLPILGTPYEECIPPDYELFQRQEVQGQKRGSFVYSRSLHRTLAHYQKFFKGREGNRRCRGAVTLDAWSESFLHREMYSTRYARLSDPFNLEPQASETSFRKRFEPEGGVSARHTLAQDVDEEMSLIAFIATWLCYFVFPARNKNFRPATLLMASLLARGERIALAPAALAYLYHGLGRVGAMTSSRRYDVEAPWHYLHGWIYEHISGSFSCPETPTYFKEQRYPLMIQLSKATAAVDIVQIRTFMFAPSRMTDRFEIINQSQLQNLHIESMDNHYEDALTENNVPLLLSRSSYQSIAEYFIGIRPSWLCYRRHDSIILEGYNPNRVARQYGFTQATPLYGLPQVPDVDDTRSLGKLLLPIRLRVASEAWAFLHRLGTGSRFYIAPRRASTGVSHMWLMWIRHTFSSFLEMGFRVYSRKLRQSKYPEHQPTAERSSEREDSHKRRRELSPAQRDHHSSTHSGNIQKRSRDASSSAHEGTIQSEPPSQHQEPELERTNDPLPDAHDETVASTSTSIHHSLAAVSEQLLSEPLENEVVLVPSADVSVTSLIHHSSRSNINEDLEEHNTTTTADVSSLQSTTQRANTTALEESIMTPVVEMEGQSSSPFRSILEPSSGSELSCFVSQIQVRKTNSSQSRFSRSLNHVTAALRELLLSVSVEALPELPEFRDVANSLLDSAATTGLNASELQQWESALRNVEFGLFLILNSRREKSLEMSEAAEAAFNIISERAMPAHENFQQKLKIMQACQKEISWAGFDVFCISLELQKLQQRRQYLMQKRETINRTIAVMEEDCVQIRTQVSELESISYPLTHKMEIASRYRQAVEERHGHKAAQAKAAAAYIREIQARHM